MLKRCLADQISQDLTRKMVFVGGARQVGKTTKEMLKLGKNYLDAATLSSFIVSCLMGRPFMISSSASCAETGLEK